MKKILPVVGAIAAGFATSPASANVDNGTSVTLQESAGPVLQPSSVIAEIIEAKIRAVKEMRVAFGEQFPDKFREKGAFSNFHRDPFKYREDPYRRPLPYQRLPRYLPYQRQMVPQLYQKSEADQPDVETAFEKYKPT